MLLRKSIAAGAHTPQDGGTARSHRATRLGEGGEGQTTTSLPPPPPPESLTGAWPPGTTCIQTPEGWVPSWPDDVPSEVWQPTPLTQPPPLGHDNSAAPTRGEQDTQSTEGAERRPPRSSPRPAHRTELDNLQPAAAEEPGQPGGGSQDPQTQGDSQGWQQSWQPRAGQTTRPAWTHGDGGRHAHRYDPDTLERRCRSTRPRQQQQQQQPASRAAGGQLATGGSHAAKTELRTSRNGTAHNQPLPPYHSESRQYRTTAHPKSKQQSTRSTSFSSCKGGNKPKRPYEGLADWSS